MFFGIWNIIVKGEEIVEANKDIKHNVLREMHLCAIIQMNMVDEYMLCTGYIIYRGWLKMFLTRECMALQLRNNYYKRPCA